MKILEPRKAGEGRKGWIRRSGEEIKIPADFGMFIFRKDGNRMRFLIAGLATVSFMLAGCMNAGGKGISADRYRAAREESGSFSGSPSPAGSADLQEETEQFRTMAASPHDPFGLMPVNWPADVPIHPDAQLAFSGEFGTGGLYLVTIIPSDRATPLGAQTFHLESLAGWESLQVNEEPSADRKESDALVIVAERGKAVLRVISERAGPGFIDTLPNSEHWLATVGPEPVVIRLYYAVLPADN